MNPPRAMCPAKEMCIGRLDRVGVIISLVPLPELRARLWTCLPQGPTGCKALVGVAVRKNHGVLCRAAGDGRLFREQKRAREEMGESTGARA